MKLIAKQDFSWAHQGVRVEEFKKGQEIETDDKDLIQVSTKEGWTSKSRKGAAAAGAADESADKADADEGGTDPADPADPNTADGAATGAAADDTPA